MPNIVKQTPSPPFVFTDENALVPTNESSDTVIRKSMYSLIGCSMITSVV